MSHAVKTKGLGTSSPLCVGCLMVAHGLLRKDGLTEKQQILVVWLVSAGYYSPTLGWTGRSVSAEDMTVQTCANCGVLWVVEWQQYGDPEGVYHPAGRASQSAHSLCPVCLLLDAPDRLVDARPEVNVVCTSCGSHFFWSEGDQLQYLHTQEKRWVPRYCSGCTRQQQVRSSEDLRALAQAARRLADAYRLLRPSLKDPEKLSLRFQRTQQRAQWIITTYGRYLPSDFVYRFQGNFGGSYPSSPFDESVPPKRALLRLREATRELLGLIDAVLQDQGAHNDAW